METELVDTGLSKYNLLELFTQTRAGGCDIISIADNICEVRRSFKAILIEENGKKVYYAVNAICY